MNTPLDEIKRLRAELDRKDQELAELRGLIAVHIEATSEDPDLIVKLEHAAFERGYTHGDEDGWRRGVEHALMEVDRAHWRGDAHDHRGQMRELGMHNGPVPERTSPEEIVALAEKDGELFAQWWWNRYYEEHPEAEAKDRHQAQRQPAKVRQIHAKERDAEREAS